MVPPVPLPLCCRHDGGRSVPVASTRWSLMIGELLLYGTAALLVAHLALDLRNAWHAMHRLRVQQRGPGRSGHCPRCYAQIDPPEHRGPARDLWWTVAAVTVLLAHMATDLMGGIP